MSTLNSLKSTLEKSNSHHLSILATNPKNDIFSYDDGSAFLSYKIQGRYIFIIGGVICDREKDKVFRHQVLKSFNEFAKDRNKKVIALHFPKEETEFFKANGYSINQLGSCYSINLLDYCMKGKRFQSLRNKVNKAKKKGIEVIEIPSQLESKKYEAQFLEIDRQWLDKKKSNHIDFMVINRTSVNLDDRQHRLFVALLSGKVQAYVLYSRSYGKETGWFHNLSRQLNTAPMGTMQAINEAALQVFKESGEKHLHFGFTPMSDLDLSHEIPQAHSTIFRKIAVFLSQYGDRIYPAKGQRQYKMSWRPQRIDPDYMAIEGGFKVGALMAFLKVTNSF